MRARQLRLAEVPAERELPLQRQRSVEPRVDHHRAGLAHDRAHLLAVAALDLLALDIRGHCVRHCVLQPRYRRRSVLQDAGLVDREQALRELNHVLVVVGVGGQRHSLRAAPHDRRDRERRQEQREKQREASRAAGGGRDSRHRGQRTPRASASTWRVTDWSSRRKRQGYTGIHPFSRIVGIFSGVYYTLDACPRDK